MLAKLRYVLGVALLIVSLPLLLVMAVITSLTGGGKFDFSPVEFAQRLRNILDAGDDPDELDELDYGWDELESVSIKDPRLEAIRREVFSISDPPWNEEDRAKLREMLAKAEALIDATPA